MAGKNTAVFGIYPTYEGAEYAVDSLKQAGAVRARREISFAEYMALKRHFQEAEANGERRSVSESG